MDKLYISFMNYLHEVKQSERGASGVEYGILVAAIAALIVVIAFALGTKIQTAFNTVNKAVP